MPRVPFREPSKAKAEQGDVLVDGPDGIAYAMEPEAAIETSERLHEAGVQAHGQRVLGERNPPPGDDEAEPS